MLLWPGCSVNVELVQMMPGGAVQLQGGVLGLNPDADTVKPEGRVSVTVVVGGHGKLPTLVTVTTNANG
jgi:hypothetical protein